MKINIDELVNTIYFIKTVFIVIFTYFTFLKITNSKVNHKKEFWIIGIYIIMTALFVTFIKYKADSFIGITCLIFLLSILCSNLTEGNIGYTILTIIISLSFNYVLFFVVITVTYIINKIYVIKSDILNLIVMMMLQFILLYRILKIKKLKNGISFFRKSSQDEYFDVIILNISITILFSFIIFSYIDTIQSSDILSTKRFYICFFIFSIIMLITIQKSIQLYYKKKLLVKELEETKSELNSKIKEVEKLEQENLSFSKKSHSLAHKQKALEFKINELMLKTEIAEELDVKDKLENISKELYEETATVDLDKTGIEEIDTMIRCMQSECKLNNIDFDLQITGNIYYMTNNLVTKEELEILIADHIKDAIIAINHSDNVNKSILVRLGEIDGSYGLYIYDSGIEFEKETLDNLGKKPCTTHKDEGGTGIGFMNTFETLRKHKASLIINEIGKPCKENYTKIIMIKFNGKDEFNVISYKNNVRLSMKNKHDLSFLEKL